MQVEDGVSDDASCFLLVSPRCHHEYWDASSPSSPEHNLISFYDALAERNKRKAALSVYRWPQIALVISLNSVRLLANGPIYTPSVPWEGRGGWKRPDCYHISLPYCGSPVLSGRHILGVRNTHPSLFQDLEWEQLVSKMALMMEQFVVWGLILNIIKHDRNTCSTRTLINNY